MDAVHLNRRLERVALDERLASLAAAWVATDILSKRLVGRPEHLGTVFKEAAADAAIVAGMIHTGAYTIADIKRVMHAAGVPTRLSY